MCWQLNTLLFETVYLILFVQFSHSDRTEVSPMLEAVVSLLSAGPVGPSDRLGYTNATILHM